MQIKMNDNWTDETLKEGCTVCLYNYKKGKNYSLFKDVYIDKLVRTILIMLAIFVFLFTMALYETYNESGIILTFISLMPSYLLFMCPFIIYIIKIRKRYNKTRKLYELFNNQKEMILEFDEVGIKLKDEDNTIKNICYTELLQVEFYKRIIVFRTQNIFDSIFISIKYEDDVKKEFENNNMSDLFKENLLDSSLNLEYTAPRFYTFFLTIGFIVLFLVCSKLVPFLLLFMAYWIILVYIFSKIDKIKLKFAMKKLNNKEIDKTIKYYDMLLNKKGDENFKLMLLYYKSEIYLEMNNIDEALKIVSFLDKEDKIPNKRLRIYYTNLKLRIYLKMKEYDKAKLIMDNFKRDIRFNITDGLSLKKEKEKMFNIMKMIYIVDTSNNKDELKMAEKHYLASLNNKQNMFINMCGYWENLMKIYKKLGNKKEEDKYRKLIKENFGEYYTFID